MAEKDKVDVKPEPKEIPAFHPNRMKLAEQAYRRFRFLVPSGTAVDDLKRPSIWAHVARDWRPNDIVEVMPDDRAWFAECFVLDCGTQYAKLQVLRESKLEAVKVGGLAAVPGHSIEYGGEHEKWRVIRDADRKILKSGHATQGDAFNWLTNHLKALAA